MSFDTLRSPAALARIICILAVVAIWTLATFSPSAQPLTSADEGRAAIIPPSTLPLRPRDRIREPALLQNRFILRPDGRFFAPISSITTGSVSRLIIDEGETVTWSGLGRHDAIVQVRSSNAANVDVCTGLSQAYIDSSEQNEFTGPMRKAVSGIMALGPHYNHSDSTRSFREVLVGPEPSGKVSSCDDNVNPVLEVQSVHDGMYYQLCEDAPPNFTLQRIWDNPDIAGVTVRINWNDIETRDDVFYFDDLDREMNAALVSGKGFFLDVRMGGRHATPDWIFNDWTGPQGKSGNAIPAYLKDYADTDQGLCGTRMTLGVPVDQAYIDYQIDFIETLVAHIKSNAGWYQALWGIKISGVNLFTSEARTAIHCDGQGDMDHPRRCWCNTRIWAGLGYTPDGLYRYYRTMANALAVATDFRKSLGYQFIQAGFPLVASAENYLNDSDPSDDDMLPSAFEQARTVMNQAQDGRFVDLSGTTIDTVAGKLFVPQHSGLQQNPYDGFTNHPAGLPCPQSAATIADALYPYHSPFPMPGNWTLGSVGQVGTGCPNKWVTVEGRQGQVIGFQTTNKIHGLREMNSALWHMTANSDGVFIELYIRNLWEATHTRGVGRGAAPLDDLYADPSLQFPDRPKNLYTWNEELHARRKWIADNDTTGNPHLADPFPNSYSYTFDEDLAPGTSETYYFISPYKCATGGSGSPHRVGQITVRGH